MCGRHGVRTTNPVRTIASAPRLTDRQLVRLTNEARLKRHLSDAKLKQLLLPMPASRTAHRSNPEPHPLPLEDDFVAWLKKHGLPMPQINANLNGREVDALYYDAKS